MNELPAALEAGRVLEDRYRVVRVLGEGGMGRVYLVEDDKLAQRRWALKELLPTGDQATDGMFRGEAEILSRLHHPHLPDVAHWFIADQRNYLVMEYIEGRSLHDELSAASGFLAEAVIRDWGVQLCETLEYLHGQQPPIIYRDIKPKNIMLTAEGRIKLIDFGIARLFGEGKQADTIIIGTPGFAAPEQYGRGQTDARSDIYSLGATLYNLATRLDPADDPFNFCVPSSINPSLSNAFDNALLKALNRVADNRFQTAGEFKAALLSTETRVLPYLASPSASALALEIVPAEVSMEVQSRMQKHNATIDITNRGGRFLAARVGANRPWLQVTPQAFEGNRQTLNVTIDLSKQKRLLTYRGSILVETDERAFPIPVTIRVTPTVWDTVIPRTGVSVFMFAQASVPLASPFSIACTYAMLEAEEKPRQRVQAAGALVLAVLNALHFVGLL